MNTDERNAVMYVDLLTSEMHAVSERHAITQRALLYIDSGYPLVNVLEALKTSRSGWYRRVSDLRNWQAANRSAADRVLSGRK